jgi:hypothetical protein
MDKSPHITLTADERHQLLSVLRELDHDAPPEQRANLRRKVHLSLEIRPLPVRQSNILSANLLNVSTQGVALKVEKSFAKGAKFLLPLKFSEGGGWLVLCEVRNSTRLPKGLWKVGARFIDRIDDPKGNSKPPMDWLL